MRQLIYELSNLIRLLNTPNFTQDEVMLTVDDMKKAIDSMHGPTILRFGAWLDMLANWTNE